MVKRADATVPPGAGAGDSGAADELAKMAETMEHERRNRKAGSAGIQAAIEDLNQRLLALQGLAPPPPEDAT